MSEHFDTARSYFSNQSVALFNGHTESKPVEPPKPIQLNGFYGSSVLSSSAPVVSLTLPAFTPHQMAAYAAHVPRSMWPKELVAAYAYYQNLANSIQPGEHP